MHKTTPLGGGVDFEVLAGSPKTLKTTPSEGGSFLRVLGDPETMVSGTPKTSKTGVGIPLPGRGIPTQVWQGWGRGGVVSPPLPPSRQTCQTEVWTLPWGGSKPSKTAYPPVLALFGKKVQNSGFLPKTLY